MKTSCSASTTKRIAIERHASDAKVFAAHKPMTCRRNLAGVALATLLSGGLLSSAARTASAREPVASPVVKINAAAANADIIVEPVRGNVSALSGSGGNIAALVNAEGKLLVDAGIGLSKKKLSAALERLAPGPVKYVINTHWHWDHTDGNDWLQRAGATIIAQENTLKRLSATIRVEDWNYTFQPAPVAARPTSIVKAHKIMKFGGETLQIHYYGPCHTDTDVYVYFEKADILVTGDTFWNGVYPFIDRKTGGSIDGMIRAADVNVARATDTTLIVPGHGPLARRADLVLYRNMLITIRANVAELKRQGKSEKEAVAAKPTAAYDAKWGSFVIDPAFFTRLVYGGV
jgi:glyoxylase-like metal-dependent hydrolase (beta-lactamase superfamily II)